MRLNMIPRLTLGLLYGMIALHALSSQAGSPPPVGVQSTGEPFSFAVIGDTPYNAGEIRILDEVIADINQSSAALVIHDGDIKSGGESCNNELLQARIRQINTLRPAVIYTPGDNEWTDCHRRSNGSFNPMERLHYLRSIAFNNPQTLGKTPQVVARQADYPENQRWDFHGITFVTLNVPGSNNNLNPPKTLSEQFSADIIKRIEADYANRMKANRQWLTQAQDHALQNHSAALVISMQGNPFEGAPRFGSEPDGYKELRQWLVSTAREFKRPVLLTHGDTHIQRLDHPLKDESGQTVSNFTRLENFGSPFVANWILVSVDPSKPGVFQVELKRIYESTN